MTESFAQRYRAFTDEELLQLALQREDMVAGAAAALEAELARRGLGEESLEQFRSRQTAETVAEQDEAPGEPLPAPMELPEDWFEENAAAEPAPLGISALRPKGVTVAAFLFWWSGAASILVGPLWSPQDPLAIALEILFGIAFLLTGVGLWRLRAWARRTGMVLLWVTAACAALDIVLGGIGALRGTSPSDSQQARVLPEFGAMLWRAAFAWYLSSDVARRAFQRAQSNRQ